MKWPHHCVTLVMVGLLFGVSGSLCGQEPHPSQRPATDSVVDDLPMFGEAIEVRVVNVEVVVTDRQGERISGLGPDDFRLIVDGVEQPIDYFSEIVDRRALPSKRETVPDVVSGETVGTNYLVYVDDDRTIKAWRDSVVRGFIDQVDRLGPGDRMAVIVASNSRLERLLEWSSDRSEMRAALEELLDGKRFPGQLLEGLNPFTRTDRFVTVDPWLVGDPLGSSATFPSGAVDLDDSRWSFRDEVGQELDWIELELTIDSVVAALQGVGPIDGRRVLMMVGLDLPIQSFPDQVVDEVGLRTDLKGFDHTYNAMRGLRPLLDTANLLGYTIYPVPVDTSTSEGENSLIRTGRVSSVARGTGGRTIFSRNRALSDVIEDTRSYYWLGFTPEFVNDDRKHDIQVVVARSDLALRHRRGYVDLSPDAQRTLAAQSALLFGEAEQVLRVEVGTFERSGHRKVEVPVRLDIPFDLLTAIPYRDTRIALAELRVAAIDKAGFRAEMKTLSLRLNEADPGLEDGIHTLLMKIELRRREHDLVFSLSDLTSGENFHQKVHLDP